MMKKIFIITITGIILTAILITGCGKSSPKPASPAAVNPPTTSTISTPAAQISSAPPVSSPPVTQSAPEADSDVIQGNIPLKVTDPPDAAEINTDTIAVKGQTVPGATVSVNDTAGVADASGNFNITVSLDQGLNAIDVIATNNSGKEGEVLILVNVISSASPAASPADRSDVSMGTIPLKVTQPLDAATLNTDTVTVKGQTEPGATVIVNDQIDNADANGNFSLDVSLDSGPNVIDVMAQDDDGNDNEVLVMVNVVS